MRSSFKLVKLFGVNCLCFINFSALLFVPLLSSGTNAFEREHNTFALLMDFRNVVQMEYWTNKNLLLYVPQSLRN